MARVSHSEVESYLLCRRKHHYGYERSLAPKVEGTALAFGSAGHSVLEAFYKTIVEAGTTYRAQKKAVPAALAAATTKYHELVAAGFQEPDPVDGKDTLWRILFNRYFPNEELTAKGWVIIASERDLILKYDDDREFPFIADIVAKDPDGKTVVVDFKFLGRFYTEANIETMTQLPKYIGALRALGDRIDYGAYLMFNKTRIIGKRSAAQPDGAGPTIEQSQRMSVVRPNSTKVTSVFIEHTIVAEEILERKQMDESTQDATAYRVGYKELCGYCDFRELCLTEQEGGNTKLLLQSAYRVRERKEFAAEATNADDFE